MESPNHMSPLLQAILESERMAKWNFTERYLAELDHCGEVIEHEADEQPEPY